LRVGNIDAAEHGTHQFVAVHGTVAMFDEVGQAFEHACRQYDRFVAAHQFALAQIQAVIAKTIAGDIHARALLRAGRAAQRVSS